MMISWAIDALILVLLFAALGWGLILGRRIARLQAVLVELAPVLQAFSDAVDQSEQSLEALRSEADRLETASRRLPADLPATATASAVPDRGALVRSFFETARRKARG
ncbi:hypothetical protein [Falsigemmobacter faecalis]|uniref:Flagellar motor switch protein n=1 Tax=Falsigemmobacter faecalis TaxID=2488730 RepID=A0A3P3DBW7_9RHOB|nr:hypothetical protein [Falsigemmobacter faecalis]RRH69878.1 hypothetical protein EG244_17910 [Falsigemmobacter faecalis]